MDMNSHPAAAAPPSDEFEALIQLLPEPLREPGLSLCRAAFREAPDGFRHTIQEALERGRRPASLLVFLVRGGKHLVATAPAEPSSLDYQFTGHRAVRGTHGTGGVYDPLGVDRPPEGWPHPPPSREEINAALAMERSP